MFVQFGKTYRNNHKEFLGQPAKVPSNPIFYILPPPGGFFALKEKKKAIFTSVKIAKETDKKAKFG